MSATPHIFIIDDEERMLSMLEKVLTRHGYAVYSCADSRKALSLLEEQPFDVVLTDLRMPEVGGIDILKFVKERMPDTIVVVMTAFGSIDSAVEAMKVGAYDYLSKPFKMEELLLILERALEKRRLHQEVNSLRQEVWGKYQFENLIGKSKQMQDLFELIRRIAKTKTTVLIYGKSGTGKELVAKAIHYNSPRRLKPFITVNCSALPETLLESELFGHVKGAFTGATTNRKGLFEEAEGGSIFLDEIGEISPALQVKLLRVLQEGEIKRVGQTASIKVDFRLIAATNRDLGEAVQQGTFREDLYYRLNVISLTLPELKKRAEDIPLLANYFVKKYAQQIHSTVEGISKEAMELLMRYSWPGNVRELENVIERAVTLGRGQFIMPEDLPELVQETEQWKNEPLFEREVSLEELEKAYIKHLLQKTKGHQTKTATILGIDRRTLYRKIRKYQLGDEYLSTS